MNVIKAATMGIACGTMLVLCLFLGDARNYLRRAPETVPRECQKCQACEVGK